MNSVWIAAAARTAVAPRDGAFRMTEPTQLACAVLQSLYAGMHQLSDKRLEVILGNALYGGGNPGRVAALAAGLPVETPAVTIDTQCCSGLDAISMGCARIAAGAADVVIAGGFDSFSRAPLRYRKPMNAGEKPEYYARPPFTPWPDRDPGLIASAARLAVDADIPRLSQEAFAMESHRKALNAQNASGEIISIDGANKDSFARRLSAALCARMPTIAGTSPYDLTAATIAVEADAAAAVILVSEKMLHELHFASQPVRVIGSIARGFDPVQLALAPIKAAQDLLALHSLSSRDLAAVEIMEAFAVQAQVFIREMNIDTACVNRSGGALSRGHPIAASGAILAVRLFHELQREKSGAKGLAAIAAAGGLGSALLLQKS